MEEGSFIEGFGQRGRGSYVKVMLYVVRRIDRVSKTEERNDFFYDEHVCAVVLRRKRRRTYIEHSSAMRISPSHQEQEENIV